MDVQFEKHGPDAKFDPIESSAALIASIKANQDASSEDLRRRNQQIFEYELSAAKRIDAKILNLGNFSKTLAEDTAPMREEWSNRQDMKLAQTIKADASELATKVKEDYQVLEDSEDMFKGGNDAIISGAKEKGEIDVHLENSLRDVEWYNKKRYKRLLLQEQLKSYPQFYQDASFNFRIPITDKEGNVVKKTLVEASDAHERQQIQAAISTAWMRPYTSSKWDQGMVKKYLYDGMTTYEDQQDTEYTNTITSQLKDKRKRDLKDNLLSKVVDGPEGILAHATNRKGEFLGGGKGSFRLALTDTVSLLEEMIDDKELDRSQLTDFLNTEVPQGVLRGDPANKKGKTYLEAFPELENLEDAITKRDKQDLQKDTIELKKKQALAVGEARDLAKKILETEGREITNEEMLEQVINPWYRSNPGEPLPDGFKDIISKESRAHKDDQAYLEQLLDTRPSGIITKDDTRGMGWRTVLWAEQSLGSRYIDGGADDIAFQRAGSGQADAASMVRTHILNTEADYDAKDIRVRQLQGKVLQDLKDTFTSHLYGTNGNTPLPQADAYTKALQTVNSRLADGHYQTDFSREVLEPSAAFKQKRLDVRRMVQKSPTTYQRELIPNTESDRAALLAISEGKNTPLPEIYHFYAAHNRDTDAWDVAAAQFALDPELKGREFQFPLNKRYIEEKLTKEQKQLMKNKPTNGSLNRIIIEQSDIDFDNEELIGD
jgi:hypothetical protein